MAINYTTLLGLAQPVTGTESNVWGEAVNNQITALVDSAIAGAATINLTAGNVTLTDLDGAADQARMAILILTGTPGTTRNVVAPSRSKTYIVVNQSDASAVIKGSATTGVTIRAGQAATCVWNGTDFESVASGDVDGPASATDNAIVRYDGATGKLIQNSSVTIDDSNNVSGVVQLNATTVDTTNLEVTNLKAKDGTAAGSIADSTGVVTLASSVLTTTDINGGTIDGTVIGGVSAAAGTFTTATATTGNITTVNATTVDTTNLEVTNLKAKDGTAAGSIADSTGVVTLASSVLTTTDINGGTIDNTTIGASTPSTVVATQVDIVAQGDLRLQDTTGGQFVALQAPGTIATSYTLTLPIDDGISGQALITDGVGVLAWSFAGVGDVVGPASSTDNAIARFDGTTGEILQDSTVTIGDDGATNIAGNLTIGGTITVTANPVVQQSDIGTDPNEIPLNQYLGALAYQGNEVITNLQNQINALYAAVYSLLPVSVNFVSLQDCVFEGTAKQPIGVAVNSTNSGNNLGWNFV